MQLLIVHRDPEMGDALAKMVQSYTPHGCELVVKDRDALDWARRHKKCDLLLTELEAEGIDGLALGSSLSELFPALQVLFFPNYAASERRLEIEHTKIFPEPIEGDELLEAIERAERAPASSPDLFHVLDVLQMCCLSRRNGAVQLVKEAESGLVFLRNGKIVHAETTHARGRDALVEMASWKFIEFAYERSVRPPLETIKAPWDEVLIEVAAGQKSEDSIARERRSA
jgi:CheY-like chemotaxis protein